VGKRVLLAEVWRLCLMPDTTSLSVHLFRLRAKLVGAGLAGLVQTALSGGSLLTPDCVQASPAIPLLAGSACIKDLVLAQNTPGGTIEEYHHAL